VQLDIFPVMQCFVIVLSTAFCSSPGLLTWWTMVRIQTFGWWLPDLVSLSKVHFIPRSFYLKILCFCLYF